MPVLERDDVVYWYLFSNHYTRECIHENEVCVTAFPSVWVVSPRGAVGLRNAVPLLSTGDFSFFPSHLLDWVPFSRVILKTEEVEQDAHVRARQLFIQRINGSFVFSGYCTGTQGQTGVSLL